MHFTKRYSDDIYGELEALQDAYYWLGPNNYHDIIQEAAKYVSENWPPKAWFTFQLSFAGLHGRPVTAMWNLILANIETNWNN